MLRLGLQSFCHGKLKHWADVFSKETLKHRHFTDLFMEKIDWEDEGLDKVRTRLASLLERWHADLTVSEIEDRFAAAHKEHLPFPGPGIEQLMSAAPNLIDKERLKDVLGAFWNLTIAKYDTSRSSSRSKGPDCAWVSREACR